MNQNDPRVLRTRQLIHDTFRKLLQTKDFDAITIKDITQEALINRSTFYAHYDDKYVLLDEITCLAFEDMVPKQLLHVELFTEDVCRQLIELTYHYIILFYQTCKYNSKSIAAQVDGKIRQLLYSTIASIFAKDENYDDSSITSAMVSSAIYSAVYNWYTSKKGDDIDTLVNSVVFFIMNGLKKGK